MRRIPISLQLYSVRDETARDFRATVAAVAAMGYTGVELAGYGNLDHESAADALDDAGLQVSGMHVLRDALRHEFSRVVKEARRLRTTHVICPWLDPVEFSSVQAVEAIGSEFDRIGADLRGEGLRLIFHNHAAEFQLLDGRPVFSWMLGAAAPRNLSAELDVYWAHVAHYAPERFLLEQGERVCLLHLKDATVLGRGPVSFAPIFEYAEKLGAVQWYVVEQEDYTDTPLASVRACYEQLVQWGRAAPSPSAAR